MVKTVSVPAAYEPLFMQAEKYVGSLFSELRMAPEKGTIHVGERRYVLFRAESVFLALFDGLKDAFGEEQAREFIYNMARIIGRSDCEAFCRDRKVTNPTERLSAGPVHFAFAGWARVDIFPSSSPSPDQSYLLHYQHPNTFESEVLKARGAKAEAPACFFSAGYSAGWCSVAYGLEVHAREIRCAACGDERCEFVMAPFEKLDEHIARLGKGR
ncbi:MAG: XylR N-terminal domain-containing protein [Myxococcales bacterium]